MSKTKAGPISADRLEGYVQRVLKLHAREDEIAAEILSMERELGIAPMWTYFIRAGAEGPVKIGIAANPHERLRGLQTAHYEDLRIIRLMRGNVEAALHYHFREQRIRGEWFTFDNRMLTIRTSLSPGVASYVLAVAA